ncbi:MAG: UDP-3-O-(3-hydroxymyristoyl)glucosamine N-acyltransferase [Chlamydiae bacterium]|nr:UDP-3-O-(3-hydroxymyristoyl)glucosamine N-acyltransferase [Chlamydiota bacterium]
MRDDKSKKFTLKELASLTGAKSIGNLDYAISGIDTLETATEEDLSFLANPKYLNAMRSSKAGIICIDSHTPPIEEKNFLVSDHPSRTFQIVVETFFSHSFTGFHGIHPTATIHKSAKIADGVLIGPYVVIDEEVEIKSGTKIAAFVYIGPQSKIGSHCTIYAHAVIREKCTLGDRVILQPGAVIGSCGFGYTTDKEGKHTKLQQLGTVIIEDDVEIGANTTIDRSRFKITRICKGTKIDNLVQIAHNVEIGPDNLIAAQSGIAGSSKTGKNVFMGGQTGVVGHVTITSQVMIATRGGVSKSLLHSGKFAGSPVMPLHEYNRQQVHLRQIEKYLKKIEDLEKKLENQEKLIKEFLNPTPN